MLATAFERYLRRMSGALNLRVRAPKDFRDPYIYIYTHIFFILRALMHIYVYKVRPKKTSQKSKKQNTYFVVSSIREV